MPPDPDPASPKTYLRIPDPLNCGKHWRPLTQFGGSESSGAGGGFSFGGSQQLQPPASGFTFGMAAGQPAAATATPAQVSYLPVLVYL